MKYNYLFYALVILLSSSFICSCQNGIDNEPELPIGPEDRPNIGSDTDSIDGEKPIVKDTISSVDLGLPSGLLWATDNLESIAPYQTYKNFSWGEVNYGDKATLLQICGSDYDAATINWGGDWHVPTPQDFFELVNNCTMEIVEIENEKGFLFTSERNGNTLFFPNQLYNSRTDHYWSGFWTGNQTPYFTQHARGFSFSETDCTSFFNEKSVRYPIRPVKGKIKEITSPICEQQKYDYLFESARHMDSQSGFILITGYDAMSRTRVDLYGDFSMVNQDAVFKGGYYLLYQFDKMGQVESEVYLTPTQDALLTTDEDGSIILTGHYIDSRNNEYNIQLINIK